MSRNEIDLFYLAQEGRHAVENGDSGRSAYLVTQVEEVLNELTLEECEWLNIAIQNALMTRHFTAYGSVVEDVVFDEDGNKHEIWDI